MPERMKQKGQKSDFVMSLAELLEFCKINYTNSIQYVQCTLSNCPL